MIDVISLITSLPTIVEGIVDTYRIIQRWEGLQEEHKRLINRAVFGSKKLVYYVNFVNTEELDKDSDIRWSDPNNPVLQEPDVRRLLLEECLRHANDAVVKVAGVLKIWTKRLQLDNVEADGRKFLDRVVSSITKIKHRMNNKRTSAAHDKQSSVKKVYAEIMYMANGCRQIEDATEAMERWTLQFKDILLTSPHLRFIRNPHASSTIGSISEVADEILFVARANEREDSQSPVNIIPGDSIQCIIDIDSKRPTGIFILESGPYARSVVDCRNIDHLIRYGKEEQAIRDTNRIARIFSEDNASEINEADLDIGFLRCCGWAVTSSPATLKDHNLVFRLPAGSRKPQTLRMLLLEGPPRHPLNDRVDFCIRLATSVLILHSVNLVHKDIRPDSILVVEPITATRPDMITRRLGAPYLGNFNHARSESSDTVPNPLQYSAVMHTLYIHPLHTTSHGVHRKYRMRDDIYSLGVCFLEIALWKSFFAWDEHRECYDTDPSVFDFSSEKYEKVFEEEGQYAFRDAGWLMRLDLIELAEREVPVIMGDIFAQVVVACLCFGDDKKPTRFEAARQTIGEDRTPKSESVTFAKEILSQLRSLKLG